MAFAASTATPARNLPGAFYQTPATTRTTTVADPTRRRLFPEASRGGGSVFGSNPFPPANTTPSRGSGSLAVSSRGSGALVATGDDNGDGAAPEPTQLTPLQNAARAVNYNLKLDESFPELDSYCRPGASSEYDLTSPDSPWAPFQRTQLYPIPDEILQLHDSSQVSITLGLFAEINHGWAAIDNGIFLWDYTRPNPEVIGFEDQPYTIQAVALLPPKPGVFLDTITHILAIATTSNILLLGVTATTSASGTTSVSLYSTKMVLNLRGGPSVSVIAGSATGRIFFGSTSDSDMYELYYQQEEGWFSNRCSKINHSQSGWSAVVPSVNAIWGSTSPESTVSIVIDDSRNLVYSLSSKSTIRTYHMEAPNKLTKVIEKEKTHCLRDITHMINGSELLKSTMNIVSISPISSREASKLHLMALTDSGCRLFLSATSSASYMMGPTTSSAPQSMQVQFIKFPPSEPGTGRRIASQAASTGEAPLDTKSKSLTTSVMGARFAPGYFIDFVRKESDNANHYLFVSSPDSGRIMPQSPASQLRYYECGTWIQTEGIGYSIGRITKPFAATKQPMGFGNELAVQFDEPSSEFAVLTHQGVYIIRRRRLVDIFAATLRAATGEDAMDKDIHKFYSLYGRVETVAAALAVACGQGNEGRPGGGRAIDQVTEDRARTVFISYGGSATLTETIGSVIVLDNVQLSNRYRGLALYLSRLIRQLWKSPVISISNTAQGAVINSVIPSSKLANVQENVERLRSFLNANRSFIQGLSGPSDLQRAENKHQEAAFQAEHQVLDALMKLMASISEGISFVQMLFDERVTDIYMRLDDTARQGLRDLTYERLFSQTSGMDLAKVLVKAIVNRNIESGSNVETVADALRRRCGSFCSAEDVVIFKAQEQLKKASDPVIMPTQQRHLLNESLRLFENIAGYLSFDNLQAAVEQYIQLQYYAGAIRLCLSVAQESDRGNSALSWVNDGKPRGDYREKAFETRRRYYGLIHKVLQSLDAVAAANPLTVDGKLTAIGTRKLEAYTVVNSSDDEVFHFDLYQWYLDQGWTDRILDVESPHVIVFLERLASTSYAYADLLCQFYKRRDRYFDAATVQLNLAKSDFQIGIKERITLLSLAKANAMVHTPGVLRSNQQILTREVTELLECAQIQDDLLGRLLAHPRIPDERKAQIEERLDGQVVSLSELFNEYADPANFYDICLLIYHAANYHNSSIVERTWTDLIEALDNEALEQQAAWEASQASGTPPASETDAAPPQRYVVVATTLTELAHRVALDSHVFPVGFLLGEVCKYAYRAEQDGRVGADPNWPIELFLRSLGVPADTVLRTLEDLWEQQILPFRGSARVRVVEWIAHAADVWVRDIARRGGVGVGASALLPAVGGAASVLGAGAAGIGGAAARPLHALRELLVRCMESLASETYNPGGAKVDDIRRTLRETIRVLDALMQPGRFA